MPAIRFPRSFGFGEEVLVGARLVRLVTTPIDGATFDFQELLRSRGYEGNKQGDRWMADSWPGAPVSLDWEEGPRAYPLEDLHPDRRTVRVRRLLYEHPPRAVVIGATHRQEGVIVDRSLESPIRTITALEVALAVPSGRARVILAHPNDLQAVPRPRPRRPSA